MMQSNWSNIMNIKVYERNSDGCGNIDGINEIAFDYELRYKSVTGEINENFANIVWESQGGDTSMLPQFYDEVRRYLTAIGFSGKCDVSISERYGTFEEFITLKI